MHNITSKAMSNYTIEKLDLNRLKAEIFDASDLDSIKEYLSRTNYKYYNSRDAVDTGGLFQYKVSKDDILNNLHRYKKIQIFESLAEADENLIIQGEVIIDSENFSMMASMDDRKCISLRKAASEPRYIIEVDLLDSREPAIFGLKEVVDFIITNNLFDVCVEISYFDVPVGIKQEKIIVWELRNY